ncbi:hypothetical protein OSK85_21880, partial [Escherichia coli]|nr:hypothetical protein [Escherichia coli]MDA6389505.1 hypothetical protein [Escherichia coli]MDA6583826.1 hypothetical protein [Escherichia coli]
DRNRSHWSTSKTPSYTKSVSWQHHRLPTLNDVRMKREIKTARKFITNCLANPNLTPDQIAHYNQCLIDLDNKLLKNINIRIDALSDAESKAQANE